MVARRWTVEEESALAEVKRRLKDQLANRPQFPEVVGDRRLIRFLRGKALNVDESVKMISAFLKWRDDNNVDDIRQDIVHGGKDTPFKFPFGKTIIDLAPQIILSANSLDKKGRPLAMEMFDFSPRDVLKAISIADYLVFLTYSLEYRAIVLEQMSHEREQRYLAENPNPQDGYGVVILDYTIRDLKGVGLAHLSSKGRQLVGAALELGLPNYQEYLGKCVMINVPWIFNTFWYFVKGFLDEETIAKINLCGSDYMDVLLQDMTIDNIPERLGGKFKLYNEPFVFDTAPGGALYCPAYTPNRRHGGRPPTGRSSLRIDTSFSPEPVSPLTVSSGLSPISSVDTPVPVRRRGSLATPSTPVRYDRGRDSPVATDGIASGSTSSSDLSSITASDYPDAAGRHKVTGTGPIGASSGQTRTAASMLFPAVRRPVLSRDREETSQSSLSTHDSGDTTEPATSPLPPSATKLSPRPLAGPTQPFFPAQPTADAKAPIDGTSHRTTTSLDERPSPPVTRKNHPAVVPAAGQYLVVVIIRAIWSELCEFCGSLYEALAYFPLKTIAVAAIFGGFLYLRLEGVLHLMVFPTLILVAMLRFDLLR